MMGWILLLAVVAVAGQRLLLGYPRPRRRLRYLLRNEAALLEAAADAMFLDGGPLPVSGVDADLPGYLDKGFAVLHPRQRTQIRMMLLLVEHATLVFPAPGRRGFRRFSRLDRDQRLAVLRDWSESRLFPRRLVFAALRAILSLGYLAHPACLRHLKLAPYDIRSPIVEADLLYPRVGHHPADNPLREADLTAPSDGTPIPLDAPLHPDYLESPL